MTAEWRKLAIINYSVDPALLQADIPAMTELDLWDNQCYVSLIGFMFLHTKVLGIAIPFHQNFEEINLRFYAKCPVEDGYKRGVVFIKEIVPRRAISMVANIVYKESYITRKMRHQWDILPNGMKIEYGFEQGHYQSLAIRTLANPLEVVPNSEAEFITEHYWGFTKIDENRTNMYEVKHPKWKIFEGISVDVNVDFGQVYGTKWSFLAEQKPISYYVAEGSPIEVRKSQQLIKNR